MAKRTTKRKEVTEVVIEHDELMAILQNHAKLDSPHNVVISIKWADDGGYCAIVTQVIEEET